MNKINKDKALELIKESKGKTFSVIFTKKDGTKRYMNCRTGVKKGVTGQGMAFDAESRGFIKVYDMQSKGHRLVNKNTLELLKINKTEYIVTDNIKQELVIWTKAVNAFKKAIGWV